MKKYANYAILVLMLIISSCSKIEDVHRKFNPNGEKEYRSKPINLKGYSGTNKVKLEWQLINPRLVTKCEVWEKDSLLKVIPISYDDTVNVECILEDLSERTYTFSVRSVDELNICSLNSDIIVEVFGDKYSSTLRTTSSLKSIYRIKDNRNSVILNLFDKSNPSIVGTIISYKNIEGEECTENLDVLTTSLRIDNVAEDSYYYLQDLYKPNSDCIDTFISPQKKYNTDMLPSYGARKASILYKKDNNSVYGELTSAIGEVVKTVVSCGNKSQEIDPSDKSFELELNDFSDNLKITTYLKEKDGTLCFAPTQIYSFGEIFTILDSSKFSIDGFSSEQIGEGEVWKAFDGDLNTYWHTMYTPNLPDYPHYLTVKFNEKTELKAIAIARRLGNSNISTAFSIEISEDGKTWNNAETFVIDNTIDGFQVVNFKSVISSKYLKIIGKMSPNGNRYMCVGEICLFK